MALTYGCRAARRRERFGGQVGACRYCSGIESAWVCAKAHRSAIVLFFKLLLLVRHDVDNRIFGLRVYLGRIGARKPKHVPCILDYRKLHAVAEPEVRDFLFASILNDFEFSFNACLTKTPGNDNAVIG